MTKKWDVDHEVHHSTNRLRPVLRKFARLMRLVIEHNNEKLCIQDFATLLGVSRPTVARYLRVLEEEFPEVEHHTGPIYGRPGGHRKFYRWVR